MHKLTEIFTCEILIVSLGCVAQLDTGHFTALVDILKIKKKYYYDNKSSILTLFLGKG